MSSAEETVVGRTLTLGSKLIVRPKVISNGERLDQWPGAAWLAV